MLLVAHIFVGGEQKIKAGFHSGGEQITTSAFVLTLLKGRAHEMARKEPANRDRCALIEENLHLLLKQ